MTSDLNGAFAELCRRRAREPYGHFDMVEVRLMGGRIRTADRWAVIRYEDEA